MRGSRLPAPVPLVGVIGALVWAVTDRGLTIAHVGPRPARDGRQSRPAVARANRVRRVAVYETAEARRQRLKLFMRNGF